LHFVKTNVLARCWTDVLTCWYDITTCLVLHSWKIYFKTRSLKILLKVWFMWIVVQEACVFHKQW